MTASMKNENRVVGNESPLRPSEDYIVPYIDSVTFTNSKMRQELRLDVAAAWLFCG